MDDDTNLYNLSRELYYAVLLDKELNTIENLLSQGASPRWKYGAGPTALHKVASKQNLAYLELILKYDLNVNAKNDYGITPLHSAASYGRVKNCKLLLNNGAHPYISDSDGRTTLHYAAANGDVECCGPFIYKGVNVNSINDDGNTPLHNAARKGKVNCCKLLVERHADFNIMNNNGETPLLFILPSERDNQLLCLLEELPLSNDHLKVCKLFFESGFNFLDVPENWNYDAQKEDYKSLEICWKWWSRQQSDRQDLIDIPVEIFKCGSEAGDIYLNERYKSQNRIYRSRICVVGPSGWGKQVLLNH